MPRSLAPQFRAMVVEQVRSGRSVAEVPADLELSEGTLFRWVRQDRIDRGKLAGTPCGGSTSLAVRDQEKSRYWASVTLPHAGDGRQAIDCAQSSGDRS